LQNADPALKGRCHPCRDKFMVLSVFLTYTSFKASVSVFICFTYFTNDSSLSGVGLRSVAGGGGRQFSQKLRESARIWGGRGLGEVEPPEAKICEGFFFENFVKLSNFSKSGPPEAKIFDVFFENFGEIE
jgi:hypothetical protein